MKFRILISFLSLVIFFSTYHAVFGMDMDSSSGYSMDHNAWSLTTSPQYRNLKSGERIALTVTESTKDSAIKAVTVRLMFPETDFKFVEAKGIDGFVLNKEIEQKKGFVTLRGNANQLQKGEHQFASITFIALKDTDTSKIVIDTTNSALIDSADNNLIPESIVDDGFNPQDIGIIERIQNFFHSLFN